MSKRTIANNKIDLSENDFKLPTADNVTFGTSTLGNILTGKANVASPSFTNNVGIGTTAPRVVLDIVSTGAILLPAGTTTQQPRGIKGLIRYNTTTNVFEGFSGAAGAWSQIGGSAANSVSITGVSFSANSFIVQTNNTSGTLGVHVTLADEWSTGTNFITLHSAMYNTTNNTFKILLTNSYKGTVITINPTYDNLQYNIILTKGREIVNSGLYRFDITGYVERIAWLNPANPIITTLGKLAYGYDDVRDLSATGGAYGLCRLFTQYTGQSVSVINSNDGLTYDIWFNEESVPLKVRSNWNNTYINFGSTYTFATWQSGATLSVTTWYDQSSQAKNLTVPSGSTQPTLELDTGGIGGYAVRFKSSDVLTAENAFPGTSISTMNFYTKVREITRTNGVLAISYNGNTTKFGVVISGNITFTVGENSATPPVPLTTSISAAATGTAMTIWGIYYNNGTNNNVNLYRYNTINGSTINGNTSSTGSSPPTFVNEGLRIGSGYIGYFKYLISTTNSMIYTYYDHESNNIVSTNVDMPLPI
jgi:hypothetical protein